jgi:P27 family predicted phage terminase small subunit
VTTRKPPNRRQGRGTADVGKVVQIPTRIPPAPHPPKRKLLVATVRAWEAFWKSPQASLVNDSDHGALERLFHMYDMRTRLERLVLSSPIVKGSTGQPVMHPAAAEVASLDARIDRLEPRFGITPKGRLDLGIAFGQAAKSLEGMNAEFDEDDTEDDVDDEDPRRSAIDAKARDAT